MNKTVGERIRAIAAAKGLGDGEELAARFDVSYETLRKWTTGEAAPNRSRQAIVAEVLGVPPAAFMYGSSVFDSQEILTADVIDLATHSMPSTISWEVLMATNQDLPLTFMAAVPDDALHSTSPRGTLFVFRRDVEPAPGKAVLVRDRVGGIYIRRYGQGLGGNWLAQATNSAYVSLQSERDGLTLLAVATMRTGGDA